MIKIKTLAKEKSTLMIEVSFEDENGEATPPDTLVWSLTDRAGDIINDRDHMEVASPLAVNIIVLSGLDLQILDAEAGRNMVKRRLIVEATYTSDMGSSLPANEVAEFDLENLTLIH